MSIRLVSFLNLSGAFDGILTLFDLLHAPFHWLTPIVRQELDKIVTDTQLIIFRRGAQIPVMVAMETSDPINPHLLLISPRFPN